ncbi:TauD/TfdA dioxygenase family protein [Kitasatospora sp. NPDC018058]|uniref:TauD/TfdA dioxygenase family protein n=1 Tax=Kitasatospora sp. NPDC018058 TaxID=3364025 RepID=UPI0037C07EB9
MPTFDLRKIGGRIGAEVTGVDLSGTFSDAVFGQPNEAFPEHEVLFLRDQDVTDDHQRADHRHTDISVTTSPSPGTTLRSVVLPPYGGDTVIANATAGYRDLPAELRRVPKP